MANMPRLTAVFLAVSLSLPTSVYADVWWLGWKRAGQAAWVNLKKPSVWGPLAGSAAFGFTNADQYVSDKARENQWLYGSDEGAEQAADRIKDVALASMFVSSMAPPPSDATSRGKRVAVVAMAGLTTWTTTEVIKEIGNRPRPDGGDNKSFPSLHTSDVASALTFTRRNLYATPLTNTGLLLTDIGVFTVEGLQGWARVEQGRHYPSDVLFGMALGNWVAGFFYDWFIDDLGTSKAMVHVSPTERDGLALNLTWTF